MVKFMQEAGKIASNNKIIQIDLSDSQQQNQQQRAPLPPKALKSLNFNKEQTGQKTQKYEQSQFKMQDLNKKQKKQEKQEKQVKTNAQEENLNEEVIDLDQKTYFTTIYQHKNYNSHIKPILQQISQQKAAEQVDMRQILKQIIYFRQQFQIHRQNRLTVRQHSKDLGFQMLNNFHQELAKQVFPKAAKYLLQMQQTFLKTKNKIPIFDAGAQILYNFSKWQVLFIMCSMTLCLVPEQKFDNTDRMYKFTHVVQFTHYFSISLFKTETILKYLKIQLSAYFQPKQTDLNTRILTVKRSIGPVKSGRIMKQYGTRRMLYMRVSDDYETIDDYHGQLKFCYTNKFLGGGQLLGGLLQQDIMFASHPQLHILLVLCQQLNDCDSFQLIGFKKYFKIQKTKYEVIVEGQDKDSKLQIDSENRIRQYISFVNHPKFQRQKFREQFTRENVDRQIAIYYGAIKAFKDMDFYFNKIVTGYWGITLHWGDARKKLTTFWIVCSMLGYQGVFCTYGDFKNIYDKDFIFQMKQSTAIVVYEKLIKAGLKMVIFRDNIHVFMLMENS